MQIFLMSERLDQKLPKGGYQILKNTLVQIFIKIEPVNQKLPEWR